MQDDGPENDDGELDIMELIRADAHNDSNRIEETMPEKMLMLAILASALQEFVEEKTRYSSQWFYSDDDSYVFSFVNICNQCGFDVEALRTAIRKRNLH